MIIEVQLENISDYYTAETLATELDCSLSMVYYLLDNGKIKYDKISPTRKIIKKDYLKDYLSKERRYAVRK